MEYYQVLFLYLYHCVKDEFIEKRDERSTAIRTFFTRTFEYRSPLSPLEGLDFIQGFQNRLEKEIESIVSTKSTYYWFHLYRRIAPVPSMGEESRVTVWIYRNIMESAFLKYGQSIVGDELLMASDPLPASRIASGNYQRALSWFNADEIGTLAVVPPGTYLGKFGAADMIDVYALERLAYEYWHTTVCMRRLYKGGILHIVADDYFVINAQDTEHLIEVFDKRNVGLGEFTTYSGVVLKRPTNYSKDMVPAFVPRYNVDQLSIGDYPYHAIFGMLDGNIVEESVPNFVWIPFDFDHYYTVHSYLEKAFSHRFGYSLSAFVLTLNLVAKHAIFTSLMSGNIHITDSEQLNVKALELMKRSYRLYPSLQSYVNQLMDFSDFDKLTGLRDYTPTSVEVTAVLSDLSFYNSMRDEVSLITQGPRPLVIPVKQGLIVDYAAILPIMESKTQNLDDGSTMKGTLFEDYVIGLLKTANLALWECKKKLKHLDGSSKEVDVSFVHGSVLFIGELKSNSMSVAFNSVGDTTSLEFRKKKLLKAIDQVDSKALWLKNHRQGTNFELPVMVRTIVPFIVTPFAEYIWTKSDLFWLTPEVPRACKPFEIEMLTSDAALAEILRKPYAIYLD